MLTTSQLIARIESNNIPHALRFEPNFKPSQRAVDLCIAAHKPAYMNRATAEMICRTSWGLYQIMGENIYAMCGVSIPISRFMIDIETQERAFYAFLRNRQINFLPEELRTDENKRILFARRYNGSSAYAAKIKQVIG